MIGLIVNKGVAGSYLMYSTTTGNTKRISRTTINNIAELLAIPIVVKSSLKECHEYIKGVVDEVTKISL
jgi:menaquinone-dependent protoporphyrinogen IX oxidase